MPIERAAVLRNAEKLVRQGKVDLAIAEYLRVVDDDPLDWNTANLLGDLYIRTGQVEPAIEQFVRIAEQLRDQGFLPKASAVYKKILKITPDDERAMLRAADIAGELGLLADARVYLSALGDRRRRRGDAQGDPSLLLRVAEAHATSGRGEAALAIVTELLAADPGRRDAVAALGWAVAEKAPHVAFQIVELAAEVAISQADWGSAAAALQEFVTRVPAHVPALLRLVGVCVDGGLEATLSSSQAQLADAYLAAGLSTEARFVAEDLVAREPWERANIERFRRALELSGEEDPDRVIADRLNGQSPFITLDPLRADESQAGPFRRVGAPAAESTFTDPVGDLEAAWRDAASRQATLEAADEAFSRGLALHEAGRSEDALPLLASASRAPGLRFAGASLVARIHRDRGNLAEAVDWFERAAQAPATTTAEGLALLYELADALEQTGESARALAICIELQSEAGRYRDVAERIDRLFKAQPRG